MVSGSAQSTSTDPVPLVFIQDVSRQKSSCAQELQEKTDPGFSDSPEVEAEVVLETIQIYTEAVAEGEPTRELPAEDTALLEEVGTMAAETVIEPEELDKGGPEGLEILTDALFISSRCAAQSEEQQKEQERLRRRELYKKKRFFCELCNKGFHQNHQLTKHMASHRKPFPCNSCDKGFYKAQTLHKHQQSHQLREAQERDPDKLLQCDQCSRKFRLLRQLRVHQASHRLEKTPLKCHACERTFTSAAALRSHEVSHAKVKPFMCDVCGKSFTRKKSLREHQTVHTGARPYPCQTCGKRFSTSGNLRVHKRSHSDERPFKCTECDKAFKCRMGLIQHRVVHSGEKPFTCHTCGLSFGLKYNLQRHLHLHNGEKPHRYARLMAQSGSFKCFLPCILTWCCLLSSVLHQMPPVWGRFLWNLGSEDPHAGPRCGEALYVRLLRENVFLQLSAAETPAAGSWRPKQPALQSRERPAEIRRSKTVQL
uniref:Zinc finger protein 883-like n=1 Tax=Cyprinodon variegatus TaxID=28743 RepID=A0A3Q2FZ76_CYPVA